MSMTDTIILTVIVDRDAFAQALAAAGRTYEVGRPDGSRVVYSATPMTLDKDGAVIVPARLIETSVPSPARSSPSGER